MPKSRPATAQKKSIDRRAGIDGDEVADSAGPVYVRAGGVLPPPLAKIRELEAENARLMRENHDLALRHNHRSRRQLIPLTSYRARTTATTCQQIESTSVGKSIFPMGRSTSCVFSLSIFSLPKGRTRRATPNPRTTSSPARPAHHPRLALHPHPHHYDLFLLPTNPPFSLGPALHLPDARPHYNDNGTSGPTLHLPAYHDERDHASLPQPTTHTHMRMNPDAITDATTATGTPSRHRSGSLTRIRNRPSISMRMSTTRVSAGRARAHRGQGWGGGRYSVRLGASFFGIIALLRAIRARACGSVFTVQHPQRAVVMLATCAAVRVFPCSSLKFTLNDVFLLIGWASLQLNLCAL
ncbi:hypothetical protein B0H13DRAFT_2377326 [Mycena leptocephala]|nr:hypothetical protein B0H13DRAFT_2377326 [Mycena leptocephala]